MPLYMDIHRDVDGVSKEMLEKAHQMDLEVQGKNGDEFKSYWYSEEQKAIFCLCEAPNMEAAAAVHRESHGSEANEIIEVTQGE